MIFLLEGLFRPSIIWMGAKHSINNTSIFRVIVRRLLSLIWFKIPASMTFHFVSIVFMDCFWICCIWPTLNFFCWSNYCFQQISNPSFWYLSVFEALKGIQIIFIKFHIISLSEQQVFVLYIGELQIWHNLTQKLCTYLCTVSQLECWSLFEESKFH